MQLHKTERARAELRPGVRTLGQRERSLLLLADGSKSLDDFRAFFNGDGEAIARRLLDDGFLQAGPGLAPGAPLLPSAPRLLSTSASAEPAATVPAAVPAAAASVPTPTPVPAIAPGPVAADAFQGKRSLASTRMFLFDICERLFARRDPARAHALREALRAAKDRASMLAAAHDMLADIEAIAGPERADAIRERIAMLLPAELGEPLENTSA